MTNRLGTALLSIALVSGAARVDATENGQSHADLGYIDTLSGLPLAPGFYLRDDINIQDSGQFDNGQGKPVNLNLGPEGRVGLKFRNSVEADVFAFAYVPDYRIPYINASIGTVVYGFVANSRAGLTSVIGVPEARANDNAGLGDFTFVPLFFGIDVPNTDFHFVLSPFEFTAPTGRYNKNEPIGNTPGLNYWSYRPALEMTYLNKTGQEFSFNISTSINSENPATHYKSGDEFYFTYAMQQYFSPQFAVGIGGYYYKQVTNDKQNGVTVAATPLTDPLGEGVGNKGETFAIGPIVSYNYSKNLAFEAHWDHEVYAYDRELRDQYWVRASYRF